MFVKLVRHTLVDDPDWCVIDLSVPIGTIYEVLAYERYGFMLYEGEHGKMKEVECFYLLGNGSYGWLPTCLFEAAPEDV